LQTEYPAEITGVYTHGASVLADGKTYVLQIGKVLVFGRAKVPVPFNYSEQYVGLLVTW